MEQYNEMLDAIHHIRDTKGTNAKMEVIAALDEVHTTALKAIVEFTYNNMNSYHISKIDPYELSIFGLDDETLNYGPLELFNMLNFLNLKGSANAKDRKAFSKLRHGLDEFDQVIADLIIGRDLRCGCGLSTFRKVWGVDFMPEFECALMGSYDAKKIEKLINFKKGAYSQLKSDGARCILTKREGRYVTRSRNGKPMGGTDLIIEEAKNMQIRGDFDLDGELVVVDSFGNIMPRQKGNGIINKASKGEVDEVTRSRIRLVTWDLILRDEVGEKETYQTRFNRITDLIHNAKLTTIMSTETKIVYSLAEAKDHYRELVLRGEEGTVLKTAEAIWSPGDSKSCRNANGFKFKEELEGDFKIVGWYYGEAGKKYEKAIGGLNIESQCGKIKSNVGTGLSDKERFMDDPDSLIETVVALKYNGRTMAEGSDVWALFLPRVIELRSDKDVADNLNKIIEAEAASRELGM